VAEEACEPTKDFLRHIANRIIAENTAKIPLPIISDIRKALGRAEDKYKFSLFGGDPSRLLDYLNSQEFQDLVELLRAHQLEWVIIEILEALAREYSEKCPAVARRALEAAEEIKRTPSERAKKEEIDLDFVYRSLRVRGYKVEKSEEGYIIIDEPYVKARIRVVNGVIEYQICKDGRAHTVDAVVARLEKMAEI
jgi:hypothetical protein